MQRWRVGSKQIDIAGCEQESDKQRFKAIRMTSSCSMRNGFSRVSIPLHHRLEPLDSDPDNPVRVIEIRRIIVDPAGGSRELPR
jgi:hypothetical protein